MKIQLLTFLSALPLGLGSAFGLPIAKGFPPVFFLGCLFGASHVLDPTSRLYGIRSVSGLGVLQFYM